MTSPVIDALAYLFATDPDFQMECEAAGVNWSLLPDKLDSVQIARRYLTAKAEGGHIYALHTVKNDLAYLERLELDFRQFGKTYETISVVLDKELRRMSFVELADALAKNPERGEHILEMFTPHELSSVVSATVADFAPIYLAEHIENLLEGKAEIIIPQFELVSKMIGGFNGGRLIMISGATGFGKTNLCLQLAWQALSLFPVGFVNMEMSLADMTKRLTVIAGGLKYDQYRNGEIPPEAIENLRDVGSRLHMTNGKVLTVSTIEAWIRNLKRRHAARLFIIDYDQKIDLPYDRSVPEWMAIKQAISRLEQVAIAEDVHIIVAFQLNRDGEVSSSHRALFTAHTVLHFEEHETHGPVIVAKKSRHAPKNTAVSVLYDPESSKITEMKLIKIEGVPTKKITPKVKPAIGPFF